MSVPCFYCCEPTVPAKNGQTEIWPNARTRDHVVPKSKGGSGHGNKVVACGWCNGSKGDRSLEEWLKWLGRRDLDKGKYAEVMVRKGKVIVARTQWLLEWDRNRPRPIPKSQRQTNIASNKKESPVVPSTQGAETVLGEVVEQGQ